jgi:hypothetical protein
MGTTRKGTRRTLAFALVLAIVAAFAVMIPAAASAAPAETTLSLSDLQAKLDASPDGTVQGYFKTVLKGSKIETIPVDILAVTAVVNNDGTGMPPKLILFEASGPAIDHVGGIASGMSGSPVFVSDGGEDKLVGAVSYGDIFTLHNTGLATPIDYMAAIESLFPVAPESFSLSDPVQLSGRRISKLVVAPNAEQAVKVLHGADTLVASPLATLQVGGIPASSPLFKSWQKRLGQRGLNLVASPSGGYDPSFSTPLTGGASVAALGSSGDLVFGAAGTVTYATADKVVAFGHPLFWTGPSGLLLTNAWVDGVWPSTIEPYKLIAPAAPVGTMVQDRSAGIAGTIGQLPEETTVTSHARLVEEGTIADATSYVPRFIADTSDWNFMGIPGAGALVAPYRVEDALGFAGSAHATSTVVVSDGSRTYTIVRSDVYDSSTDIASETGNDVFDTVLQLQSLNAPDIQKAHIVSVDLDTTMTRARSSATVLDMTVPGGLHTGLNTILTTLRLRDGTRQVVQSSLYLPRGTSLEGYLAVGAPDQMGNTSSTSDSSSFFMEDPSSLDPAATDLTVADVAKQIASRPKNTDLVISYSPMGSGPSSSGDSIDATTGTTSFLQGGVEKSTTQMLLMSDTTSVGYGGMVHLEGMLLGAPDGSLVTIMRRVPGSADTTIGQVRTSSSDYMDSGFTYTVRGLTTNATLIARYDGNADLLPSQSSVSVRTTARVVISASTLKARTGSTITLGASVSPTQPSGTVVFEVLTRGSWRALKTVTLSAGKTASFAWKPGKGTYPVRARFTGSTLNVGAASAAINVVLY